MTTLSFKENVLELLAATGYSLDLKNDHLSSFEGHKDLHRFIDWFTLNVNKENCITYNELKEFQKLEENGEVLYGDELENALKVYHDPSLDSLVPCTGSFNETVSDEVTHIKEQLRTKQTLLSLVRSSTSAVADDTCQIYSELKKAESHRIEALKNHFAFNKKYNSKLAEVKTDLHELQENLSDLNEYRELSADEGIGTLSLETLSTSTMSISSTTSTMSSCSNNKSSHGKYICQLSFHKYNQQHKKFCKIMERIILQFRKAFSKVGNVTGTSMESELELQHIMERLFLQKKTMIENQAKLEGIKAARDRIKDLQREIQNNTWNPSLLREFADSEHQIDSELEDSFDSSIDDLSQACENWAELQILKPVCDRLNEKIQSSNYLIAKMDEIIKILKSKVAEDTVLHHLVDCDVVRVKNYIQVHTTVQEMIKEKLEATKKRLEVMAANVDDYKAYCALPIEERSELIERLAMILGSDKKSVAQAVKILSENSQKQHELLFQHKKQQLQTILSFEHNMKDLYNKEMQTCSKPHNQATSELIVSIQKSLYEMSNNIQDTTELCQSIEENGESIEEDEVQEMINKLVHRYNSK